MVEAVSEGWQAPFRRNLQWLLWVTILQSFAELEQKQIALAMLSIKPPGPENSGSIAETPNNYVNVSGTVQRATLLC
jgi:hypothetical protein